MSQPTPPPPDREGLPPLLESALQRIESGAGPVPPSLVQDLITRFPDQQQAIQDRVRSLGDATRVTARPLEAGEAPAQQETLDQSSDPDAESALGSTPPQLREIGHYKILDTISRGGQGEVFLALQSVPVQRRVALKLFSPSQYSREGQMRFELEAQALAMMEHSSIAKIYDSGFLTPQQPFLVMEHIKGLPLDLYCDRNRLTIQDRIELFLQLCAGVQHAHLKGVIHRDLKPSNVMVTTQDGVARVKLIDFGLARMTQSELMPGGLTRDGQLMGTPDYMSPEQATSSLDVDTRTDVYALGAILYRLLTGHTPFEFTRRNRIGQEELRRIREEEPKLPSYHLARGRDESSITAEHCRSDASTIYRQLRGDIDWIVMKALDKDRVRRYETVATLVEDIRRYLEDEPVMAGPPSVTYRLRKFLKKYRGRVASAAAILLVSIAGTTFSWNQYVEAEEQRGLAESARQRSRRALEDVELLRFVPQVDGLLAEARTLQQDAPGHAPELEQAWIASAEVKVRELSAQSPHILRLADGGEAGPWAEELDPDAQQLVRLQLGTLITERLPRLRAQLDWMQHRARWAEAARRAAREESAMRAAWQQAIRAIAGSEVYRDLPLLEPQSDLLPLGPDRDSGLWEFLHLPSEEAGLELVRTARGSDGRLQLGPHSGIVFVLIPPGELRLGASGDRRAEQDEMWGPRAVLDGFLLAKHELTQGQWARLAQGSPEPSRWGPAAPDGPGFDLAHPVERVSWNQSMSLVQSWGLTLPTEAQWEYAARAGVEKQPWWWSAEEDYEQVAPHANLADQSAVNWLANARSWPGLKDPHEFDDGWAFTAPVWTKKANRFGLHHVLGNVYEWCRDTKQPYQGLNGGAKATCRDGDGLISESPGDAVIRGGSYANSLRQARLSDRAGLSRDHRQETIGLRPARSLRQ